MNKMFGHAHDSLPRRRHGLRPIPITSQTLLDSGYTFVL